MASERKYWTAEQLKDDIRYNRAKEQELALRIRSELNPSRSLFLNMNTAKLRAEASEEFLEKLKIDS